MTVAKASFGAILDFYRQQVEGLIQDNLSSFGPDNDLKKACAYALLNGGKRFRPALVLMIAKALDKGTDASLAALSVEYFHTASLIADDLPCMDNDDFRRDKPALHKAFGESVALLSSYALIAAGYAALAKTSSPHLCALALENASFNTGIQGATGGQFLDLHGANESLEAIREALQKKTVTLFEISFVFGWLFGGGDPAQLAAVKKCAAHFGMAFQIADDLGDREQDFANGSLNLANVFGQEKAKEVFSFELKEFNQSLESLNLSSEELVALSNWLAHQ